MFQEDRMTEFLRCIKPPVCRREDDGDSSCYDPNHEEVLGWLTKRFGMSFVLRKSQSPDGRPYGGIDFYAEKLIYGVILGSSYDPQKRELFNERGWFVNDKQISQLRREIGGRPGPGVGWIIYYFFRTGDVYHTTLNNIVLPGAHVAGTMTPGTGATKPGIFIKPEVFWHLGNYKHEALPSEFR